MNRATPASDTAPRMAGAVLLILVSLGIAVIGMALIEGGFELAGTVVWGYNDSPPGVYVMFGGLYALVGFILFFVAALLSSFSVIRVAPGASRTGWRPILDLAAAATFALVSISLLVLAVAAAVITPHETSSTSDAVTFALVAFAASVPFAALSVALARHLFSYRTTSPSSS